MTPESSTRTRLPGEVKVIPTGGCTAGCGGKCVLKFHVKDGVVLRIETDDGEEPLYRACARGRAQRQRIYAPDRLQFPQKRVGARGEGKFERISWDEALDTVARQLKRVKEMYGNSAIFYIASKAAPGALHSREAIERLLNMFGGYTARWQDPSAEASVFASRADYGTLATSNTRDDLKNSRLIITWGWNPAVSIQSTNTSFYLAQAREAGARIVCVDPRYTDTAAIFANQWIPIRPATDTAVMVAMAYVIIHENLQDQKFLDTYTIGFDQFKEYVLGIEDRVSKTPLWAQEITGVPAVAIEKLARDYATIKPAALMPGFAPGRTPYGEQFHRVASALAAMTGNIGVHGGNAPGFDRGPVGIQMGFMLPVGKNPTEARAPHLSASLDSSLRSQTRVNKSKLWDAILRGKAGGYPSDIKLLWSACGNPLNECPNTNKGVQALKTLEFVVVNEQFLTATARFADILLPAKMMGERTDIFRPWLSGPYYIFGNKAIESPDECKTEFEIACELALRLGVTGYSDKTEDEWLRFIVKSSNDMSSDIPDYDEFKRKGIYKIQLKGPLVAFEKQIQDPRNNPFPTPSGKIEIYCQRLAELNNPQCPPIPKYIEPLEGPRDPLAKKYPLQLITSHFKLRAHSTFNNIPWLREIETQALLINSADANARRIRDGDLVRVFNDRGQVVITAKVTERIMPGVVDLPEGGWYHPDEHGLDRGGCPNVLTSDEISPGGALISNTSLVQVEKA